MVSLLAWVEVNKTRILLGVAASLGVILVAIVVIQRQAQKEITASAALSEVRLPFSASTPPPAGTADALLKVANDHQGTKAAARALLISASLLFTENTPAAYAEAQKRFERVAQDYPDSPWAAEANFGVASSLQGLGKTPEAISKYEEVRRRFATSAVIGETKLALARLYETQKPEEAFKLYEELMKENASGSIAMESNMRQEELIRVRPELAKLKEQAAPSPGAGTSPQDVKITQAMLSNAMSRARADMKSGAATNPPAAPQSPAKPVVNPAAK